MMAPLSTEIVTDMVKDVSEDAIEEAARSISANYGVWDPLAETKCGRKASSRVRMSSTKLLEECLSAGAGSTIARAITNKNAIGHVCTSRWTIDMTTADAGPPRRQICWVTRLVVHLDSRRQGLATRILRQLREQEGPETNAFGILSSHPAAMLAFLRAFCDGLENRSAARASDTPRSWKAAMTASPVRYIKSVTFDELVHHLTLEGFYIGMADTKFYVDHTVPAETLGQVEYEGKSWLFESL
jgi:hypothetical protein